MVTAEHYGFQLDDNPHDTALLPRHVLAHALGSEAAAQLKAAQASVHACGVPSWALLQVAWSWLRCHMMVLYMRVLNML